MQTIKWELTPYCNLHCRHCGAESKHKRKILSLEENKIIANMLKEQGVTSIRFAVAYAAVVYEAAAFVSVLAAGLVAVGVLAFGPSCA